MEVMILRMKARAHEGEGTSSVHTEEHQTTDASHTTDTTAVKDPPHVQRISMASK